VSASRSGKREERVGASKGSAKPRRGGAGRVGTRIRWERRNVTLLGAGLGAVLVGYILLSRGDITAAPILLVAGYCVLVPLAFIL
jgi:hypothetical protein